MRNKLPLLLAAAMGIAALFAIRSFLKKEEANTRAKLKGQLVWAAASNLRTGAELTPQNMTLREVPDKFIPPDALQGASDQKLALGRKVQVEIKEGQLLQWIQLEAGNERRKGLSAMIPEGEAAYTINVSKGIKPGLIQPSDRIDIIGSFSAPKPSQQASGMTAAWRQSSDMVNVVLLQNVTVLNVGDTLASSMRSDSAGGDLTLALTLQEAQMVMFASEHGELGAVLRRQGSTEMKDRQELSKVTFEAIDKIIGDLDGRRKLRLVEVSSGGKTESIPVKNSVSDKE